MKKRKDVRDCDPDIEELKKKVENIKKFASLLDELTNDSLGKAVERARQHREGIIICTDCGTVYELKCTAESCPYRGKSPLVGLCVIMHLRSRKFDVCPDLKVIRKGNLSDL